MKKVSLFLLFFTILGCKKDTLEPIVTLNGIYEGTIAGWAQPTAFSGTTIWTINHEGNEISANVSNQVTAGFTSNFTIKGNITSDSTISCIIPEFQGYKVNIKYSKDMNNLSFENGNNGDADLRVRFKGLLIRKK